MHDDETVVSELVAQALEHRDETGTEIDLAALCGGRPDLQTKVLSALKAATRLPMLQSAGLGGVPTLGDAIAGRYRIEERLGAGAMGVVYAASDDELGRRVAIKVLHHGVMEREQALSRFEREAEALAAVRQESVVTIHDRGTTDDGAPYLVMELVEGIPLSGLLDVAAERSKRGEPVDGTEWLEEVFGFESLAETSFLRQAARWARDLAGGLVAVHAAGIVHRDVKPSNIMIRWDGRPVILDFGAVLTEEESNLTRTGAAVGTPAYMAPETLARDSNEPARPASDLYGLAATLYHLLAGVAPYAGTPSQILANLATRDPVPAAKLRDGLPRDLQAILDKGMARRPRQRYADAGAFERDLDAFLNYRVVSARPVTSLERMGRALRRSRAFQGGAAVALAVLMGLGWSAWSSAQAEVRAARFAEVFRRVPSNYGVVTYANRVVADETLTEELGELFDRMVETDGQPVVAHALRAAYRLDHGDSGGSAGDMKAVAGHLGTPYAGELAERYAGLPADASSARALNLKELPAPSAPLDHYLAGFHAMRQLRYGDARPFLSADGLEDVRHARELLLLLDVIPIPRLDGDERFQAAGKLYEDAIRIETRFGSRSAMSAHLAAYGLLMQERHAEALVIDREALALAPASHSTSLNAARDAFRSGFVEEAQEWVTHTTGLLPHYPKAYETELLVRIHRKEHAAARAYLGDIPYSDSRRDRREKLSWQLRIDANEALMALQLGDQARAEELGSILRDFADNSQQTLVGDDLLHASLGEAIVAGDRSRLFSLLCDEQIADPLWPGNLQALSKLMPKELDSESTSKLVDVFTAIRAALNRRSGVTRAR